MNKEYIKKLAFRAGLVNYIDNETPRHYFISAETDMDEVEEFARLIVVDCLNLTEKCDGDLDYYKFLIKSRFGIE